MPCKTVTIPVPQSGDGGGQGDQPTDGDEQRSQPDQGGVSGLMTPRNLAIGAGLVGVGLMTTRGNDN